MGFDLERDTVAIDETQALQLFARYANAIKSAENNRSVDGIIDLERSL